VLLKDARLLLRPVTPADVPAFASLLNDYDVAKNLSLIPHPYTERDGFAFIFFATRNQGTTADCNLSVIRRDDRALIGMCGIHPSRDWEIAYWIGKPFWGQGYGTETMAQAIAFAFDKLDAPALTACWFLDNPASGRIFEKLGFEEVGRDLRPCLARNAQVPAQLVRLDRDTYMRGANK
jgi:ribosomal-protein-alanine N-acetyltransferase